MLYVALSIKKHLLRKLINKGKIGGSHTALINLYKGLPSELSSNKKGRKLVEETVADLIKSEFLLVKQSCNEKHVSINPRKIREIKELLGLL